MSLLSSLRRAFTPSKWTLVKAAAMSMRETTTRYDGSVVNERSISGVLSLERNQFGTERAYWTSASRYADISVNEAKVRLGLLS